MADRAFTIPYSGSLTETVIQGSFEFISDVVNGCTYSYSIVMQDGSFAPTYYDFEMLTGKI